MLKDAVSISLGAPLAVGAYLGCCAALQLSSHDEPLWASYKHGADFDDARTHAMLFLNTRMSTHGTQGSGPHMAGSQAPITKFINGLFRRNLHTLLMHQTYLVDSKCTHLRVAVVACYPKGDHCDGLSGHCLGQADDCINTCSPGLKPRGPSN